MQKVWYRKSKQAWFATILEGGHQKQIRLVNAPNDKQGRKLAEDQLLKELAARDYSIEKESATNPGPSWATVAHVVNAFLAYSRGEHSRETAAWHKALFGPAPEYRELVATSERAAKKWRFTIQKPADGWEKPEFDATAWAEADGGFGTKGTPGAIVRTEWKSADIWVRRSFDLPAAPTGEVFLRIHHDEDAEIYVNGVLAAKVSGWTSDYTEVPLTTAGRKALKPGPNVIAIHCHQTTGGQYIDAGFVEVIPAKPSAGR